MDKIAPALQPLVAQAAHALRGHLDFLARMGVSGLPLPSVAVPLRSARSEESAQPARTRAGAETRSVPPPPAAPLPPTAAPSSAPVVPPVEPAAPRPPASNAPPWARYLTTPPDPADAPPAPRPAAPAAPVTTRAEKPAPLPARTSPEAQPPAVAPRAPMASTPIALDTPRSRAESQAALEALRAEMGDCQHCKLCKTRKQIVFGVGNPVADICFVGEGPGADEDLQGEPFVGKAGQLLTQMIKAMGYQREEVYICNVVKCRPPNNRDPEEEEVLACQSYVLRQIEVIRPRVLVALGKHAAWMLCGEKVPITRMRGTWKQHRGIPLMPTFHPSYLLRNPDEKRPVWEDLKAVLRHLGRPVPEKKGG